MGRDGPTTRPERVTIVSITVLGKYRVDATINSENMLQRIHTWVGDPVLGDMNYEHESTNESYIDLGGGIRFPTGWHSHQGWDDNYQAQSVNDGHNAFGGTFANIRAKDCGDPIAVPGSVRAAGFPAEVDVERLADGVHLLAGASHNSVAIEFDDFVTVIEERDVRRRPRDAAAAPRIGSNAISTTALLRRDHSSAPAMRRDRRDHRASRHLRSCACS